MISIEKAQNLVLAHTGVLLPIKRKINNISSDILAEDIKAKVDLPQFSNSSMDGFALRAMDTVGAPVSLRILGCIKAGNSPSLLKVGKGEAFKIMTGAPLPQGADAVVMREEAEEKNTVVVVKKTLQKGENIRLKGEEIKRNQVALKKGSRLNPASGGFLAALGCSQVKVFRIPRVALLITGNELIQPGRKLPAGKIWEANSVSLTMALSEIPVVPLSLGLVRDRPRELKEKIQRGLKASNVLLISGGISVGDYDFVQETILKLGVRKIFWRVAVKPGKPVFFGTKGKKLVFGLPGNPVSILVSYLEFVRPALLKMMGKKNVFLQEKQAFLEERVVKKNDRAYLLRGIAREDKGVFTVRSAGLQDSHFLDSFSRANCLMFLEKKKEVLERGESVKIHLLPWESSG